MELLLLSMPWLGVGLFMAFYFRDPPKIRTGAPWTAEEPPFVSIIIPARNEEANIGCCLSSLASIEYPAFEILVVDDRSQDRTAEIVEELAVGMIPPVRLLRGEPLPEGWFGKPWACWQGAGAARGDILLFTDADTVHAPNLLDQTVRGLRAEKGDVFTIIGQQIILYLAGLQDVPQDLYDAADVDGANSFHKFSKVTLPMLTPVIFFHLVTSVIGALQFFTVPYIMTGGTGFPAGSTMFYSIYLYKNAFQYFQMGYASAMAWLLFMTTLVITLIIFRSARMWVFYGG